jgi:hypothetical protein
VRRRVGQAAHVQPGAGAGQQQDTPAQLAEQLENWLAADEPAATVVARVVEGMSDFTSDTTWHSVRLELLLAARRAPRVRSVVLEQRAALTAAVTEALERVAGHHGLVLTVEASDLAHLLLAAYDGRLNEQIADPRPTPAGPDLVPAVWPAFTRPRA